MQEENVKTHPIWATLDNFRGVENARPVLDALSDPAKAWSVRRVFDLVDVVRSRLGATPTTLVSVHYLNQLNSALANAYSEVTQFIGNENIGHLANAAQHLDKAAFGGLLAVPIQSPSADIDALNAAVTRAIRQADSATDGLAARRIDLDSSLTKLQEQIGDLGVRIGELQTVVAGQKAEANTTVEALRTTYAALEQDFRSRFDAQLRIQSDAATQQADDLKGSARSTLSAIEVLREQAAMLVQVIGNIGATGNYQKVAVNEAQAADRWRGVTVGFFVLAIGVGAWALFASAQVSWTTSLARLLFAFLVASVTLYTSRESARHRSNADRARRIELELASLGPFLADLPPEKQHELRTRLTEMYFGKEGAPHTVEGSVPVKKLWSLFEELVKARGK